MFFKFMISLFMGLSSGAFASEGNQKPDVIEAAIAHPVMATDSVKGTQYIRTWLVGQEGLTSGMQIPGNVYFERVDFQHSGSFQSLYANVWIGACTGDWGPCRRSFSFSLQCRDDYGNTRIVQSPYYRNYQTSGYEYRDFSFSDPNLVWCSYIDNVWVNGRYGW